jgi:hypothetical protein
MAVENAQMLLIRQREKLRGATDPNSFELAQLLDGLRMVPRRQGFKRTTAGILNLSCTKRKGAPKSPLHDLIESRLV